MICLELPLKRCLEDVIKQERKFFWKGGIGGELRALALERGDCMSDESAELRQLAEHEIL